jgi:hypothetical protein
VKIVVLFDCDGNPQAVTIAKNSVQKYTGPTAPVDVVILIITELSS